MINNSRSGQASLVKAASEKFCLNLSQAFHAAAQPLTVLRASLCKERTDRMSLSELREFVASSAIEVERVCAFFSCLQQFVATETIQPHLAATPLLPLLECAVDGVNLLFEKDGMSLLLSMLDDCQPVMIDRARTLQALSSVLLVAYGVSCAKDTVQLIATSLPNAVQVVVSNVNAYENPLSAEASLSMALAEANIRSQQGHFSWSLQPFNAEIELQTASFEHY
jgi:hypothetical protein